MGMCLEPTTEMGEYSVEVFEKDRRHAFHVYPSRENGCQGTVEILIEDIPKIRAALDQVEQYLKSK